MGLLRPATPLSVVFLVAFVLMLLSTLSTPIIEGIPLGSYQGYNFGVLGYCKGSNCVGPRIGYSTDGLFSGTNQADDFSLPSSARHSLSSILIVHPIAALLCLICFALAVAAHFHGPSHSPRFLLALLILTFPTLLIVLLAFLVDILLFVPHMQWGGWIVLGATILIIVSSIVTCAMRRTLVSRKARKKRIAENADMNGQNYYENLAQQRMNNMEMADSLPKAESPPPMSGSTAVDKGGNFATCEMKRQDTHESDRTPLNPGAPSIRSASSNGGRRPYDNENVPPMPGRPSQESNGMYRRPSRDQYGNPIPPGAEIGAAGMAAAGLRHQGSQGSLGQRSNGSNGYPPNGYPPNGYARGRGGYGPPARGYGPPRGGYGPPRGGYGPRGGRGGCGPPPPGFNGRGRGRGYGPPPGMMRGGMPPHPSQRQMPPPGYDIDPYYSSERANSPQHVEMPPAPGMDSQFVAGPAMPIGQAIEMDERNGGTRSPARAYGENEYGLRDSDGDVAGMINLQLGDQGHHHQPPSPLRDSEVNGQPLASPSSMYSDQTYQPPRQQWQQPAPLAPSVGHTAAGMSRATMESSGTASSDPHSSAAAPSSRALPLSPVPASPSTTSPRDPLSPHRHRAGSETYYEDVDPRFAQDPDPYSEQSSHRESGIPGALTPGPSQQQNHYHNGPYRMTSPTQVPVPTASSSRSTPVANDQDYLSPAQSGTLNGIDEEGRPTTNNSNSDSSLEHQQRHSDNSASPQRALSQAGSDVASAQYPSGFLEPIPDGARSPGEASESSHFTSVSQRGVNPNWRPGPGGQGGGHFLGPAAYQGAGNSGVSSASAAMRRKEDVILSANPDFSLPGMGLPGRGRGRGRGRGTMIPPSATGLTPAGRYPTPDIGNL